MSNTKVKPKQSTIENLTKRKIQGIANNRYEIQVYVPLGWVSNPVENIGVSSIHLLENNLKNLSLYSNSTLIKKINKTNIILAFEVSEPYLKRFYDSFLLISDEADLKLT